jgi:Fe-S cluster assembly protein SufD
MSRAVEERAPRPPAGAADQAIAGYAAEFDRFDEAVTARQPAWLTGARRAGMARFRELGFPTTRQEAWRFTSVAPIARAAGVRAGRDGAASEEARDLLRRVALADVPAVVLLDGRFAPELSSLAGLPPGVVVSDLMSALGSHRELIERHLTHVADATHQPFVALNTAFLDGGVLVVIPARTTLTSPLQLTMVTTGAAGRGGTMTVSHPRVLLVAGERGEGQLVETYVGPDDRPYFTNAVTEVVLDAGAILDHYKLQREGSQAAHLGSMYVEAARSSTFSSHSLALGGQLVRNDVVATLGGEGAECTLNGLYLAGGTALVDNHTTIDHAQPHCPSHEIYKGILWDRARAVFNGKIIVRPDAQKTDAKQTNKALLLSDQAQINTKPELEIFANDVKCTHGAAIGQLDEDALFYLRARGLTLAGARAMLIQAFAGDIIQRVKLPTLRAELERMLRARLPEGAS